MLPTFLDRLEYLKFSKQEKVGDVSFGGLRELNQKFYKSREWRRIRDLVIVRDNGCDLAIDERPILSKIYVHHINPILPTQLKSLDFETVLNPEFLITVSFETHNLLHYGIIRKHEYVDKDRFPGDTKLW